MADPQPLRKGKCVTMMTFGVPGSGKTRLLGSAAGKRRVLIIRPPTDHTDSIDNVEGIDEIVLEDHGGMIQIQHDLHNGLAKEYDWVALDSFSLMQDFLLDDVVADALMRKPTRGIKKAGELIIEYGADKGEYKINFDRERKWVSDMVRQSKAGNFNFMITAHPIEWYDPVKEEDVWAPWIQGKGMIGKICGYMNIVAYMSATQKEKKPRQETLLVDSPGFMGKDQFNSMPKLKSGRHGIINPTLLDIEAAVGVRAKTKTATGSATRTKRTRKSTKRRSRK